MYKNLVLLDKQKHKTLKLSPMQNFSFASEMTFIPIAANEIAEVATNLPVVFAAGKEPSLISLVSIGSGNVGINKDGGWFSNYVPSYLKKYPFAITQREGNADENLILIDDESALFSKSKGKQLFKKNAEESDTLKDVLETLVSHEKQMIISKNITQIIEQSGILEDGSISIGQGDTKKVLVNGFKVVNREKFHALSDVVLAEWVRKGIVTLIDTHLKSLSMIQNLFNLELQRKNQEA